MRNMAKWSSFKYEEKEDMNSNSKKKTTTCKYIDRKFTEDIQIVN